MSDGKAIELPEQERLKLAASSADVRPWRVHRTGSHIALRDAKGATIIRKAVSQSGDDEYMVLLKNLNFIVAAVNAYAPTQNP